MRLRATHPHPLQRAGAAGLLGWLFALTVLLMSTSMDAFAQDNTLTRYQELVQQVERARVADLGGSTVETRDVLRRSIDDLRRFKAQNKNLLDQPSQARKGAPAPERDPQATLYSEDFNAGIPGDWTVIDNEGNGVVWDELAGPGCGESGNFTNGSGDVACASSDEVGPAEFDTELLTPSFNFCNASNLSLLFTANYQNFAFRDFFEVDISDAGGPWVNLLSWNEDHGAFRSPPGEDVNLDISAYDGLPDVQIRFHYYDPNSGDFDWYIQVDDFVLDGIGTVTTPGLPSCAPLTDADLEVIKTVSDATPDVGDVIEFWIEVNHLGGGTANGVRITDKLPPGVSYVSHSATQGTYDPGTGIWQVGALAAGAMESLHIVVQVDSPASSTNTAFVAFSSLPDPNPGNNRDSATINPNAADLSVRKSLVEAREDDTGATRARFKVVVSNSGPSDVWDVEVTDTLCPDMTLVGLNVSEGIAVYAPPDIIWGGIHLDVGQSATMYVTVDVPDDGCLTNVAEVTASGLPDPDSVPGDGTGDDFSGASASDREEPDFSSGQGPGRILERGGRRFSADLSLTKEVDNDAPSVGDEIEYTIRLTNSGPQTTNKVQVTDHLPECLELVGWSANMGSYDGWIWDVGQVPVDSVKYLKVQAVVTAACQGEVVNTAWITRSSLPDPDGIFNAFDQDPERDEHAEAAFTVQAARARVLDGTSFALGTNYPNPFNPETVVPFSLAGVAHVSIKVYDLLGREVAVLVEGELGPGVHEARFRADRLPTGVYLVRMEAAGQVHVQRVTLMK